MGCCKLVALLPLLSDLTLENTEPRRSPMARPNSSPASQEGERSKSESQVLSLHPFPFLSCDSDTVTFTFQSLN